MRLFGIHIGTPWKNPLDPSGNLHGSEHHLIPQTPKRTIHVFSLFSFFMD
jgi:hypothetical protein